MRAEHMKEEKTASGMADWLAANFGVINSNVPRFLNIVNAMHRCAWRVHGVRLRVGAAPVCFTRNAKPCSGNIRGAVSTASHSQPLADHEPGHTEHPLCRGCPPAPHPQRGGLGASVRHQPRAQRRHQPLRAGVEPLHAQGRGAAQG